MAPGWSGQNCNRGILARRSTMGALYEFFSDSPILVGAALGVIIAVIVIAVSEGKKSA